jgi:hypothetical protein
MLDKRFGTVRPHRGDGLGHPLQPAGHGGDAEGSPAMSTGGIHFTYAPRTPALAAMHMVGKMFPRATAPRRIVPHATSALYKGSRGSRNSLRVGPWPQRPHFQRLLHLPCAGTEARMRSLNQSLAKGWQQLGPALPALCRCRDHRTAAWPPVAAFAVPGVGRHGARAADRHAEPRDDRGARRSRLARRAHGVAALVFAPFRALIGFKSDTHRSVLGWRRVPYIWFGTMMQFGGFAILPFALLVLTGERMAPPVRPDRCGAGFPAGGCRHPYHADGGTCAGQ